MREPPLRTRLAALSDIPALLALEGRAFTGYYAAHRFGRAQFQASLRNERAIAFVATRDGAVVGYALGLLQPGRGRRSSRLESIGVDPAHRDKGVGGRLLAHFLRSARQRSASYVTLEVAADNAAGRRFFQRRGFRSVGRLPAYYSPVHDGVRMRLDF